MGGSGANAMALLRNGSALFLLFAVLRCALLAIAWACVGVFLFWCVVFNLPHWSWAYQEGDFWEEMRQKVTLRNKMMAGDHSLLDGFDNQMIILLMAPPLVAALCVSVARMLPQRAKSRADYSNMVLGSTFHGGIEAVRRVLAWQIPPRRFWLWWSAGMALGEFVLVTAWIAVHFIALWNHKIYSWGQFDAWDAMGLYYNVPKSVYALDKIAISWGWILYLDFALLFFPISHSSFLNYMFGIPFPALLRYHRWLGHLGMWSVTAHALFYYLYWTANPEINFVHEFFDWGQRYFINLLAGSISWFFGLALWFTSLNWVRRKYFEVFYKTHIIGFVGFVLFAQMHYYWMWTCWLPGLLLYAADLATRLCQIQNVSTATAKGVCEEDSVVMIKLSVDKNVKLEPLQDLFVCFPSVSRWQYHPFSVARADSASACPMKGAKREIVLSMKSYGKWTSEVIERFKKGEILPVRLNGPFGGDHFEWRKYDVIHLYAGGIGAVPLISLLQDMIAVRASASQSELPNKVVLLWATRNRAEFNLLTRDIVSAMQEGWLDIRLFSTGSRAAAPADKPSFKSFDKTKGDVMSDHDAAMRSPFDEKAAHTVPSDDAQAAQADLKFPGASNFFWNVARPLQPKTLNELETLLVIVMTWIGGWCGLVLCQAFVSEYVATYYTEAKYWKTGLFYTLMISIQAVGLPTALVVFPKHLYRYVRFKKEDAIQASEVVNLEDLSSHDNHAAVSTSRVSFVEVGLFLDIQQGRPDFMASLKKVVEEEDAKTRVAVCCAGPEIMMNGCSEVVSKSNGNDKGVYVEYHRLAYQM